MTNRREFLQTGVAVSALPLAADGLLFPESATAAVAPGARRDIRLYKAIFDDRYAEGRGFAEEARRSGTPVRALKNGDVTDFWYDELDLLWRRTPAAIAGLTQFGPMFVLERLAQERGLRTAMRIEHRPQDDGSLAHVNHAPPESVALMARAESARADWPALAAALATQCRADCAAPASATVTAPGWKRPLPDGPQAGGPESVIHYYTPLAIREGQGVPWDGPLYTWVLAPSAELQRGGR